MQVRTKLLGLLSQASRIGSISAPLILMMGASLGNPKMPFIIVGAASVAAAFLVLPLPETTGLKQFESLDDMAKALSMADRAQPPAAAGRAAKVAPNGSALVKVADAPAGDKFFAV